MVKFIFQLIILLNHIQLHDISTLGNYVMTKGYQVMAG